MQIEPPLEMTDDDREFYRWYGPWRPLRPTGVKRLLGDSGIRWWIIGGWAIEAFTGLERDHEDIDVSFFGDDLGRLIDHLSPTHCIWSNLNGTLRPLKKPDDNLEGARQMWVRRDGASPWVMDLAMNPNDGETWISVRDETVRIPIDDATFTNRGISYLRPEIVMWMKARIARPKDDVDFAQILPRLDAGQRTWLRERVASQHPDHRWLKLFP
jgi:hypothetical protein